MKIRSALVICIVLVLATVGLGESVVIIPRKTKYNRPKPIQDYKKWFTIIYPEVRAATPALSDKIEAAISYKTVLGLNLKEELNDVQWLEAADYEVGYNKNWILSITLSIEGSGAYPSGTSKAVVVDLKTGTRMKPSDAFTNLPGLLTMVKKAKAKEVADAIIRIKKDPESRDANPESYFKEAEEYQKLTLNEFSVNAKGVTFHYDYGFPHVIQAWQPDGEFKFTWKQLKPYIKAAVCSQAWLVKYSTQL